MTEHVWSHGTSGDVERRVYTQSEYICFFIVEVFVGGE